MRNMTLSTKDEIDIAEIDIAEVLKETEINRAWIKAHFEEIRAKYEGKVFAVKDKKVVAASEDFRELLDEVQKKGEDSIFLVTDSIPPRALSFIL